MDYLELFDDFVADQPDWSGRTRAYYRARLKPFGEYLQRRGVSDPAQIQVRHINRYLAELREVYAWSTRNGTFTAIQAWFGWLKQMGLVQRNLFNRKDSGLRRPRRVKRVVPEVPLTYARRIIQAAEGEDRPMNRRDGAIMRLLLTTGMRREEVIRLDLADLDLVLGEIRVIQGKGDHQRRGILPQETVLALERWLESRPRVFCQAVFISLHPNKKGLFQRLRPDAINDIIIRWRDRAGLPRVSMSPHKWRHTFASQIARSGHLFALQELLGHADISSTRIYTTVPAAELRRVVERYGPRVDPARIDQNKAVVYNNNR